MSRDGAISATSGHHIDQNHDWRMKAAETPSGNLVFLKGGRFLEVGGGCSHFPLKSCCSKSESQDKKNTNDGV